MPRGVCLLWGGLLLGLAALVWAADQPAATPEKPQPACQQTPQPSKDSAAKEPAAKDVRRHGTLRRSPKATLRGAAKRPTPRAQASRKYLQIRVAFQGAKDDQGNHKFRIVNEHGDEVGDLWGWNESQSLVVFEGDWSDLNGLYLDGNGHRESVAAAEEAA